MWPRGRIDFKKLESFKNCNGKTSKNFQYLASRRSSTPVHKCQDIWQNLVSLILLYRKVTINWKVTQLCRNQPIWKLFCKIHVFLKFHFQFIIYNKTNFGKIIFCSECPTTKEGGHFMVHRHPTAEGSEVARLVGEVAGGITSKAILSLLIGTKSHRPVIRCEQEALNRMERDFKKCTRRVQYQVCPNKIKVGWISDP